MSTSAKDKTARAEPKSDEPKGTSPQAGRIVHDSRGNAVWNWNKGNDSSSTASTSKMLKKLELADLRVEDDTPAPEQAGTKKKGSGYGPGYNPYNRTSPVRTAPKKGPSR